jgi:hypothetical protein
VELWRLIPGQEFQKTKGGFLNVDLMCLERTSPFHGPGQSEDPGGAKGKAACHHCVAVPGGPAEEPCGIGYVAITGHRDVQALSEGTDKVPPGGTAELFPGGAGVQRDEIHPLVLKAAAKVYEAVQVRLHAQAELYAEAFPSLGPDLSDEGGGFIGIGHPADARAVADYGRGGATHVKVDAGAVPPVQQGGGRCDLAGIRADKLIDHAGRAGTAVKVIGLEGASAYKRTGADHLAKIFVTTTKAFD